MVVLLRNNFLWRMLNIKVKTSFSDWMRNVDSLVPWMLQELFVASREKKN